jgi:hypothetical protein
MAFPLADGGFLWFPNVLSVEWVDYGEVTALRMGLEIGEVIVTAVVTVESQAAGLATAACTGLL